ncbi:MAG: phosphoserine phosphatase SerB [Aestuariibacter sp.]
MFFASLSPSQFFNATLFHALCRNNTVITELTREKLTVVEQPTLVEDQAGDLSWQQCASTRVDKDSSFTVVITTESMNLEKVWQVYQAFSEVAELGDIKLAASHRSGVAKIAVSSGEIAGGNDFLDQLSQQYQLDIALLSSLPDMNKPGIVLMDMDSTVIQVECIDEIARLADIGEQVASVTELAMQGKLDFAESLHKRVACLQGIDVSLLQGIRDRLPLMPGLTTLLTELKARGWILAIASGGFTYFADYLKERLSLDYAVSNTLEISNGKLTGKVSGNVVDAAVKAETLELLMSKYGIERQQTITIGDGANDLTMMNAANLGVAFHAKPLVRAKADCAVQFGGLDTVLAYLS